jgi:hypothetical protein
MAFLLTALVLLILIAGSVTIVDAVRAPHWRVVAVERRQSWRERTSDDEPAADNDDGLGAEPISYSRG